MMVSALWTKFFDPNSFVRQPWVVIVAVVIVGMITFLLLDHNESLDKAAFLAAMAGSGMLLVKAPVSMASDAPGTACILLVFAVVVLLMGLRLTNAASYADLVVEGVVLHFIGGTGSILDEAIKRSNRQRGITQPKRKG